MQTTTPTPRPPAADSALTESEISSMIALFPHEDAYADLPPQEYLNLRLNQAKKMRISQRRIANGAGLHKFTMSHLRANGAGMESAIKLHLATGGFIHIRYTSPSTYELLKELKL